MLKAKVGKSGEESVELEKVGSVTRQTVKHNLRQFFIVNNQRWDCQQLTRIVNFRTLIVNNHF
jgi:hypothetical protein